MAASRTGSETSVPRRAPIRELERLDDESGRRLRANLCAAGALHERQPEYVLPHPVWTPPRGWTQWDAERWDRDFATVAAAFRDALEAETRGELVLGENDFERIGREAVAALPPRRTS